MRSGVGVCHYLLFLSAFPIHALLSWWSPTSAFKVESRILNKHLLDINSSVAGVLHVLTQVHHGKSRRAGRASRLILTSILCFDRDLTQSKYRPRCLTLGAQSAHPGCNEMKLTQVEHACSSRISGSFLAPHHICHHCAHPNHAIHSKGHASLCA